MNPQKHFAVENMEVPPDNNLTTNTRPRGFWESRVYEQTDFQQRPPFLADSNYTFDPSNADEMRNDSSDVEGK